jgi:DinB family protein
MTTIDRDQGTFLDLPAALTDPAVPQLPTAVRNARRALETAAADYLSVPESALLRVWLFRGVDPEDGVRYGMYRGAETIELADAELEAALAGAPARAPGAIRSSPATIARWALQGRLAALDDALLEKVPRDGEWTLRETLDHLIAGQRGYGVFSRWWLTQPLGNTRPARIDETTDAELEREMPADGTSATGSLPDIRAELDDALDEWALRVADLDAAALAASAMWSGVSVDIDFRLGRWASHIREHTIQLDKTLDWLGYSPTEPARIVRDLFATWGRLEARIFPVMPGGTEGAVAAILDRCSRQLVDDAGSTRAAAEA